MLFRFWRRKPETPIPLSRLMPRNERPRWAAPSNAMFPTSDQTHAGNQTPTSRWRANGGRW
ncbi:hypothetical protein [Micromonospora sp. IBSANI012]|uniref:hypothetical protein n=1 Tax=Micromonospora sp. IBSANI012 TaxID=3457761 RepID=UPI00405A49DE